MVTEMLIVFEDEACPENPSDDPDSRDNNREVSIDGQGERLVEKSEFQSKKEERKVGKYRETKRSPALKIDGQMKTLVERATTLQ